MKFTYTLALYLAFFFAHTTLPATGSAKQRGQAGSTQAASADQQGPQPIHFAAFEGRVNNLRYFIEQRNIDPNIRDEKGLTPLHYAALGGHVPAIEYLISRGANINARDINGSMPIHYAAFKGHTHILKYLIEVGRADKDVRGVDDQTPLHYAALNGHLPAVEYLIKQRANIKARDTRGSMPIHLAAIEGHTHILKHLIEVGCADKNVRGPDKQTPLHYAVLSGRLPAVEYLIKQGCTINAHSTRGSMPIHYAAIKGHTHILKHLIEVGRADKDAPGPDDQTPLHYAASYGHLPAVEYLIKQGCNIEARDKHGLMPVHLAAIEGHTLVLKHLIEEGRADKNAPGPDKNTPLHYAASKGHLLTVEYLVEQGANINARCTEGLTPLYYAWAQQHENIVNLITGLTLTYDKDGMLIPIFSPYTSDEITEWRELMCEKYAGKVPSFIEDIAQEAAAALGENNIFFFHTSSPQSHAGNRAFSKIGLSKLAILAGFAYKIKSLIYKPLITQKNHDPNEISFKSTLYHELCHTRAKHTTKRYIAQAVSGDNFTLALEMEAELGAMYYLYTIDKKALFTNQINDNEHPSQKEHWRYIAQLYARLLDNPAADFAIVEELAELYRQEKTTGRTMVKNIILPIAKQLFKNEMLSKPEYAVVVYTCSGRMPITY